MAIGVIIAFQALSDQLDATNQEFTTIISRFPAQANQNNNALVPDESEGVTEAQCGSIEPPADDPVPSVLNTF